ncbi:MAG: cold-shock protein [Candidatus Magasanikbacteria bacterium CG11_big_fil_rev_8_21_14_0_20_39_34]|uniref:Cold-shock protein n=1 Tax=Candidatus Magasanikbacteria bacterium CG11_big_fil_rev_8_21_14_0_20_39_34 TaxID=1974653 RepID=A0A2H0N4H9_9BACT|nr:MAG: cold-shock protein [Candidatus Magasanikbacteria bacterium CG11_big_fil_rev_8_21_14_0_20_39_34]
MTGTIKRIIADKGFGFIEAEGREKDIFFHVSQFDGDFNTLKEGDRVNFEVEESPRGPQAINVTLA